MPSKTLKKPVKKAAAAKKPFAKKKIAPKTAAKPAPKKAVAAKSKPVVKKTVAKKVAPKAAPKVTAKKPAVKKPIAKKAVVKKAALKKVIAKKVAPKKTAAKKPVTKKPVTKKIVKTPVKKAASVKIIKKAVVKSTPKKTVAPKAKQVLKKPLATLDKTAVKTSAKAREITPIKAPVPVVAKPRTVTDLKIDMNAITVPPDYEPTDTEEFMSPVMKEYFRQRLFAWRDELLRESGETLTALSSEGNMQKPDITDRASEETDLAIEFRTRDRERKLLNKINEAVQRIEDGSYGYCEETGDAIPVKRLIARPTAVRTLEAEELHERRERTQRDQYE